MQEEGPKLGKSQSRLGEIRPDVAAASFTALLDRAKVAGPPAQTFINSGEVRPQAVVLLVLLLSVYTSS